MSDSSKIRKKPIIAKPDLTQSCYNCNTFDKEGYEKTKIPCSKRKRIHKGVGVCVWWTPITDSGKERQ